MSTATKKTKKNETPKRILNLGTEIELKKLGVVTVRELCLEDVLKLSKEISEILDAIATTASSSSGTSDEDGMAFIVTLLQSDATSNAIRILAAATTNKKPRDFERMGLADWLRWANAFKDVADWEELRELFTHLVPSEVLQSLGTSLSGKQSPRSSTGSRPSTVGLPKRS